MTRVNLTPLEACTHAAELVKRAGFIFSHTGRGSTSTYYSFPGRVGLLRISTHRGRKPKDRRFGDKNHVASLTFSFNRVYDDGTLQIKAATLETEIAFAIGRYMLASKQACLHEARDGTTA